MAGGRPHSQGLKYFSFDTDFFEDEKIYSLIDQEKEKEVILYQRLLCWIYKNGSVLEWTPAIDRQFRQQYFYSNVEVFNSMIQSVIEVGLLNKKLFTEYNVLTSRSIQDRYIAGSNRYVYVTFVDAYMLVNIDNYVQRARVIELFNRSGEMVQRYEKIPGENPKQKSTKRKQVVPDPKPASVPQVAPVTPPVVVPSTPPPPPLVVVPSTPPPPPPVVVPPIPPPPPVTNGVFNNKALIAFMNISYDNQPVELKQAYSRDQYDKYILLQRKISDRFDNLRLPRYQLTLKGYYELISETKVSDDEVDKALVKMSANTIHPNMDFRSRLTECIGMVRTPFKSSTPQEKQPTSRRKFNPHAD